MRANHGGTESRRQGREEKTTHFWAFSVLTPCLRVSGVESHFEPEGFSEAPFRISRRRFTAGVKRNGPRPLLVPRRSESFRQGSTARWRWGPGQVYPGRKPRQQAAGAFRIDAHIGRSLDVVGVVDQRVVRAVDRAVVVQVAVGPPGQVVGEAGVDRGVVGPVDGAVEVRVAVVGVLDQDVGSRGSTGRRRSAGRCRRRGEAPRAFRFRMAPRPRDWSGLAVAAAAETRPPPASRASTWDRSPLRTTMSLPPRSRVPATVRVPATTTTARSAWGGGRGEGDGRAGGDGEGREGAGDDAGPGRGGRDGDAARR